MAIDNKYGKVATEKGDIAEDEPVFIFRAKDRLLPHVLTYYRTLCESEGSPEAHVEGVRSFQEKVAAWQALHYTQTPGTSQE